MHAAYLDGVSPGRRGRGDGEPSPEAIAPPVAETLPVKELPQPCLGVGSDRRLRDRVEGRQVFWVARFKIAFAI